MAIAVPSWPCKARGYLQSLRHGMLKRTARVSCLLTQEKLNPALTGIHAKMSPHPMFWSYGGSDPQVVSCLLQS